MLLPNYYWYFQSAIPERICDEIVRYGKQLQNKMALTGAFDGSEKKMSPQQIKDLKKKRNSDIVWIDSSWVYKEIHPYIHKANKSADWNFQWDWSEPCQFTKYEKGQFYDWHCDSFYKPYNEPNSRRHGKIRKLSVTVSLSDPKDYKGGELEFDFRDLDPDKKPNIRRCTEILPKGSLVVFPGFVWHRVKPVTQGTRYSLVMWCCGRPWQ